MEARMRERAEYLDGDDIREGAERRGVSPLLLGNLSHLQDLDTRDLLMLSEAAACRLVRTGESLYRQGDRADDVYLLLDGTIRLEHLEPAGCSRYDVEAPYESFGDLALLGEAERRYTATALTDAVVIAVPGHALLQVLARNDPQALAWRGAIMARLHRREPFNARSFGWRILGKLEQLFDAA